MQQWDRAGEWLTQAYHQHNPNAASGLDGVVAFFTKVMKVKRVDKCDKLTTEVVAVMADDDYVTVMMPRKYPDPRKPGAEYYTTWFDTWRFVNGKADEHWDPATIAPPAAKLIGNKERTTMNRDRRIRWISVALGVVLAIGVAVTAARRLHPGRRRLSPTRPRRTPKT